MGECNGTAKKKEYNVFSANFAPRLRFVPRLRRPNLAAVQPYSFFSPHRYMIGTRRIKQTVFFVHAVWTNATGLDRVPGMQRESLFTSERQYDDGVLKISRRKSPGLQRALKPGKVQPRTGGCLWDWDATRPLTKQILTSGIRVLQSRVCTFN